MIRVSAVHDGQLKRGGLELLDGWTPESPVRVWVDITSSSQPEIEPLLEHRFHFHELAAEDAISPTTQPKYDAFPGYDFFVFRSIVLDVQAHKVDSVKLSCFLGTNFLFTVHHCEMKAIETIWNRLAQDTRMATRGVDFLLHAVLDILVDSHFPLLEEIEERTDEIHELIFSVPSQSLLNQLLKFKRDLNVIRRHSLPQRELFNQLSRGDAQFIHKDHLIYFRDLYDHMFRIGESIDVERDLATSTMEAYLSVVANRTNDIMKVLTIISTILLPINTVAAIYGMNFEIMPELHWHHGYLFALSLMVVIAALMLTWFGQRGWLWTSRKALQARERHIRQRLRNRNSHDHDPGE